MKHNISTHLLAEYNYNKNNVILATPDFYNAFKTKIESCIKADMVDDIVNSIAGDGTPYQVVNGIALIDFAGFTVGSCDELEAYLFGLVSLQDFCDTLQLAIDDESVTCVVINFDSGGGYTSYGDETIELIQNLKMIKPIYAYTCGLMCSMAYQVACNCNAVIASPSSLVGSIGVYAEYVDLTAYNKINGIDVKTFQGGNQKTIGSPYISLTPDQEKQIQDTINQKWDAFKQVVKDNRGDVKEDYMQGQAFTGKDAIKLGTNLIDGNCNSINQFIQLLSENNN